MFKKILIGIISLFFLLIIVIGIAIVLIPKDKILSEVITKVNESGEISLDIKGKTDLHFFPNITVDIENATVKTQKDIVASVDFQRLELSIGFLDAIRGNYDIKKIILTQPIATIDISNIKTAASHQLMVASNDGTVPQFPTSDQVAEVQKELLKKIAIDQLKIIKGDIRLIDNKNNLNERFQNVDLDVSMPKISKEMTMAGSFLYNGSQHQIDLSLDSPKKLLIDGDNTDTKLTFQNNAGQVKFDGDLKMINSVINYDGNTSINISNIKSFLNTYQKFTGNTKDIGYKKLSYKGTAVGNNKEVKLNISKLLLDTISATGDMTINFGQVIPFVKGKLNIATLDLTAGSSNSPEAQAVAVLASRSLQIPVKQTSESGNAMDKKIDVSAINKVNADLNIFISQLILDKLQLNSVSLHIQINNDVMNATFDIPTIMQGLMNGNVMVNAKGTTPRYALNMVGTNIESSDLMNVIGDRPYISGRMQIKNNLKASGDTPRQMIQMLNGIGNATIAEGSINGIDLEESSKDIMGLLANKGYNSAKKTPIKDTFVEYVITNGVVNVNKLQTITSLAAIYGSGTINLPQEKLNLYMKPSLSREKTVLDSVIGGPFYIRGTFDNIKIVPDVSALAPKLIERGLKKPKDLLENPKDLLDAPKDLIKKPKDILKLFR